MSRLETPDPDGAQVFYAAVFGWTTEASDIGETRITVFRLPGYVGGEPEQAFSREVVATMSDATGDAPAHWSVRFWVADVDAAVATTKRLQGTIVAGPFEYRSAAPRCGPTRRVPHSRSLRSTEHAEISMATDLLPAAQDSPLFARPDARRDEWGAAWCRSGAVRC
jgi:predicted enzyme related to lactoylglutathione lyase